MSSPTDPSTPDGEVPPSQAIIQAIAAHEGVDVTEIEPPAYDSLFTVVNPEALDELFRTAGDSQCDAVVTLEYEGYEVVVRGGHGVEVRDLAGGESVTRPIGE